MPQFFKGDATEKKFYNSAEPIISQLSQQKDLFYAGAYSAYSLGGVLYDTGLAPLTNAIRREIYRENFFAIFEAFLTAGSFESYILVFKKIFGDDVEITFTVPAPGQLNMEIAAAGVELSHFVAREIVANSYVISNMITQAGENIVFQGIKGFTSQYELEQMLFEMVPDGIYTQITLTLGA